MKTKQKLMLVALILTFVYGSFLGASNYQLQLTVMPAGTWEPIGQFSPSATSTQYIDATESTTYGTVTNDPPNGMGADSDGPTGDTELLEASYVVYSWSNFDDENFESFPDTGWTQSGIYTTGIGGQDGGAYGYTSTATGFAYFRSPDEDTSGYSDTRIRFYYKQTDLEAADFYVQVYTTSLQTVWECPAGSKTVWTSVSVETGYANSGWYARWYIYKGTSGEYMAVDTIYLDGEVGSTYYRFEAVFRFDSVTTGLSNYYLYIDFYTALTGSDDLDFYIGTSSNPTNLIGNDKQDDFNVDVGSYITDSTIYLKVADDYRSGDTGQTTAYIQRVYLYTANSAPLNEASPTCSNLDNTDYMYANLRAYEVTCYFSDADGYADIYYVIMRLYSNNRGSDYWYVQYIEDTDTFSENDEPDGWIYLNTTASSYSKSDNDLNITFVITIEWPHTELTDVDVRCGVYDSTHSDDDYYEVDWNIVSTLELSTAFTLDDGSGTATRGDIDGAITASGELEYYGSSIKVPDVVDVWVKCSEYGTHSGYWNDTTLSSGAFSMTVYADDEAGEDTYTVHVYKDGESDPFNEFLSINLIHSGQDMTENYTADYMNFTATTSITWTLVGESITVSYSGLYGYDGSSVGSQVWSISDSGSVSYNTVANRSWHIVSYDNPHGITVVYNVSAYCIWDDIEITSGPAYYWTQYSETAVWLIWGAPTSYAWGYNSSAVQDGIKIQSQVNGTNNAWAITSGGSIAGLSIGSFTSEWWYVNISIRAQVGGYDWIIWTQILEVDILHSLQVVSFSIIPTDDYFWIQYQTNLLNASIIIWDDVIDSGTLYADNIYYSAYEGMHQIPRSSTVGAHNLTICITSTGTLYNRTYDAGSYVWWYNFTYIVNAMTLEEWQINIQLDMRGSFIEFYVRTSSQDSTVYAYDNGTLMVTATEQDGGIGSYFWLTESPGTHTITLNITDGSVTITRTKTYYVPDWASGGLSFIYWLDNYQSNGTSILVQSNWGNCTFSFYLNGSLKATTGDDPGHAYVLRSTNTGTWNLTIVCDGGSQTATIKNIYLTVTEEGTTYVSGGYSETTVNNNYYVEPNTVIEEKVDNLVDVITTVGAIAATGGVVIVFLVFLIIKQLNVRERLRVIKEKGFDTN